MTNLPSHFKVGIQHVKRYKYIRLALGLHPLRANEHISEYSLFKQLLDMTSYIGEVGLDFSRDGVSTKEIQLKSFEFVLECIKEKRKILSIHSRKAEKQVFDMLTTKRIENAIFHWYSGNISLLHEIVSSGYFFSINAAMTRSINGQRIIAAIPKEFVLTETDFPFIDNGSINQVQEYLAWLWNIHIMEVEKIIGLNFNRLINNIK